MPADRPTILATSGGIDSGTRTRFAFTALTEFAVDLSGVTGRSPRMCLLATAMGDDSAVLHYLTEAAQARGFAASHLSLFPMPNVEDITAHLVDQDVVRVFGGSVAGLLAMWRLHGVDAALRVAWQAGVVLTGISAGSICWHVGGTTLQRLVGQGTLPAAYATDDGAGVLYRGTEFVEAVSERSGAAAYFVDRVDGGVIETRRDTRRL